MPITPSHDAEKLLDALGVKRPIPKIYKPAPPAYSPPPASHVAVAAAPVARNMTVPVAQTTPSQMTAPIDILGAAGAFIRWSFFGAGIAALVAAVAYAARIAGVLAVLACTCLPVKAVDPWQAVSDQRQENDPLSGLRQTELAESNPDQTPRSEEDNTDERVSSMDQTDADAVPSLDRAPPLGSVPRTNSKSERNRSETQRAGEGVSLPRNGFQLNNFTLLLQLATMLLLALGWVELRAIRQRLLSNGTLNATRVAELSPNRRVERERRSTLLNVAPSQTNSTPTLPSSSTAGRSRWTSAVHTITGPVRDSNQDFATLFRVKDIEVLAIADGCGGVPHGAVASKCAAEAAAGYLRERIVGNSVPTVDLMTEAFQKAEAALAFQADALGFGKYQGESRRFGLRTTLMLVVATRDNYFYGYIGDGTLILRRRSAEVLEMLEPQRVGNCANVLAASLGPSTIGSWVIAQSPRELGDILIAATDGIADSYDPRILVDGLSERIAKANGDVDGTVARFLQEANDDRDEFGNHRFDDNLTLAILVPARNGLSHSAGHNGQETRFVQQASVDSCARCL